MQNAIISEVSSTQIMRLFCSMKSAAKDNTCHEGCNHSHAVTAYLLRLCLLDFINHGEFPFQPFVEQLVVLKRWGETVEKFLYSFVVIHFSKGF